MILARYSPYTLAVPRKNPLPATEIEICRRLREFRTFTRLTQAQFAYQVGLDWRTLASYEYARNVLNYTAAVHILRRFRALNPFWLAEGPPAPMLAFFPRHYPSAKELGFRAKIPFSTVFELRLRQAFLSTQSYWVVPGQPPPFFNLPQNLDGRIEAVEIFANLLSYWLAGQPDTRINEFLNAIMEAIGPLAEKFPHDPPSVQLERFKALFSADAHFPLAGPFQPAASSPIKCPLTEFNEYVNISTVETEMARLLERLKTVTRKRGKKSELARVLGVPLASVSQWLSGAREPSGETTLRLQKWVLAEEAKQNVLAGADNTGKDWTQERKSNENKSKPSGRAQE